MKRSTKIWTKGVDPLVVKLRTEQVRQGVSDYRIGKAIGMEPSSIGSMWKGKRGSPSLSTLRPIVEFLRRPESEGGNPGFVWADP